MPSHIIATVNEIGPGEMKGVIVADKKIVLFCHEDGTFSALEDRCSHAEVNLSRGKFCNGEITCPAHGARFDARTGKNLCMPAVVPVKSLPLEVQGNEIIVTF